MFTHFGQRLKRDLKQIVDRRLEDSVAASGNLLKVCTLTFSNNSRVFNALQSSGVEVDVISHKRQRYVSTWFSTMVFFNISCLDMQCGLVVRYWHHL